MRPRWPPRRRPTPASRATSPTASRCPTPARRRSPREYPQYATQITAAAQASFLAGDQTAYIAGIIAVLVGAALVFFVFPKQDDERKLLMEYHEQDMAAVIAEGAQQG